VTLRRLFRVCVFAALLYGLGALVPGAAEAKSKTSSSSRSSKASKKKKSKKVAKVKLCSVKGTGKKAKKRCSFVKEFQGHGVAKSTLRTDPLTAPSGDVWLRAANLAEEAKVNIYKADGSFNDEALAQLDELFRCKRTGEVRAVDPRLYEQLSRIQDHFGGKQIELVSGFRFAERSSSRHYHASAMDIRIKGVSIREMYDMAESLDGGGMGIGIYPRSGFIHVDYRAPGEPSYRWTDYSPPGSSNRARRKKPPGRTSRARRPNA
jgi:uncharacterized protein YcbK (DUF882 family)